MESYSALLNLISAEQPGRPVVVEPYNAHDLAAVAAAADWADGAVILVGDKARIDEQLDLSTLGRRSVRVIHTDSPAAAAAGAAEVVAAGDADYVVKGSIASADLLRGSCRATVWGRAASRATSTSSRHPPTTAEPWRSQTRE